MMKIAVQFRGAEAALSQGARVSISDGLLGIMNIDPSPRFAYTGGGRMSPARLLKSFAVAAGLVLFVPIGVILLVKLMGQNGFWLGVILGILVTLTGASFVVEPDSKHWGAIALAMLAAEVVLPVGYFEYRDKMEKPAKVELTKALQPTIEALRPKLLSENMPFERTELTNNVEMRRPYVIVYLGLTRGGCGCSHFQGLTVLNDEGIIAGWGRLPGVAEIRTIVLLQDHDGGTQTYRVNQNGTSIGTDKLQRYYYDLWAFDLKTGILGARVSLWDPDFAPEYRNFDTNDHLGYADFSKWADSVTSDVGGR